MRTRTKKQEVPEVSKSDPRIKRITGKINLHQRRPDALIEVLHMTQDLYGYVPLPLMHFISRELKIPPSRVYGVVTFYHFFCLKPKGEHNCLVCTGTACYVKGANQILEKIEQAYDLTPGETTRNNRLGLQTARCIGSCGLAPAVVLDGEILPSVRPEEIAETIRAKIGEMK